MHNLFFFLKKKKKEGKKERNSRRHMPKEKEVFLGNLKTPEKDLLFLCQK
jgi:hypothetical protein